MDAQMRGNRRAREIGIDAYVMNPGGPGGRPDAPWQPDAGLKPPRAAVGDEFGAPGVARPAVDELELLVGRFDTPQNSQLPPECVADRLQDLPGGAGQIGR